MIREKETRTTYYGSGSEESYDAYDAERNIVTQQSWKDGEEL